MLDGTVPIKLPRDAKVGVHEIRATFPGQQHQDGVAVEEDLDLRHQAVIAT